MAITLPVAAGKETPYPAREDEIRTGAVNLREGV